MTERRPLQAVEASARLTMAWWTFVAELARHVGISSLHEEASVRSFRAQLEANEQRRLTRGGPHGR